MTFSENTQHHLVQKLIIAQIEQPSDQSGRDPLISYEAEYLIDFGVILIAITLVIIIGMISQHTKTVLLFALALSAFLIIVIWNI